MNYSNLLDEASGNGLIVKEKPLLANTGRIKGNRVAIKKDIPTVEKCCVLAEELGHYFTTVGDILDQSTVEKRKQEFAARLWAYDKMIGLSGITRAYEHGCSSIFDMAEYLEVTEEFLKDALEVYRSKYGCFTKYEHYIIYFEPFLGVLEGNRTKEDFMLRPTAIKVTPKNDYLLDIEFGNGELREFDVKPYIKGSWFSKLLDVNYFNAVSVDGFTVTWPDGQDLCPDELYELSVVCAV